MCPCGWDGRIQGAAQVLVLVHRVCRPFSLQSRAVQFPWRSSCFTQVKYICKLCPICDGNLARLSSHQKIRSTVGWLHERHESHVQQNGFFCTTGRPQHFACATNRNRSFTWDSCVYNSWHKAKWHEHFSVCQSSKRRCIAHWIHPEWNKVLMKQGRLLKSGDRWRNIAQKTQWR